MPTLRLTTMLHPTTRRQDGTKPIVLRINYDGQRVYASTGFECRDQDFRQGKTGPAVKGDSIITQGIRDFEARAWVVFSEMKAGKERITAEAIRARLLGAPSEDFISWASKQVEQDAELSANSKRQHRTALSKLETFTGGTLPFSAIDYAWLDQFSKWLANQDTERGSMPSQNYVSKLVGLVCRNINEAYRHGKIKDNPCPLFKKKKTPTTPTWCTLDEVLAIASVDTRTWRGKMQLAKDVWLLQFYTGLRFKDAMSLKVGDLEITDEPEIIINYEPRKTRKAGIRVNYSISKVFGRPAENFLFRLIRGKEAGARVLDDTSAVKQVNQNLKRLAKAAGVKKPVTSHVARHSCAMWLLNEEGLSIEEVAKVLGHKDITTTQVYARLRADRVGKRKKT